MEQVERLLAGDRRAVAKLISLVENDGPRAREALAALYAHTGRAHIVGVTGAPGTGKSTLVNELAKVFRQRDKTLGIVAVDPTSPFSGGALLGDRIRMRDLAGDPGIFVRSMATRGSLGGLARATGDAVKVLDAAGYQVIFIETVGAGQAEVDIARTAHTTIVVEVPGLGDDIQAIKAGIFEIADIFAVNKADREGAEHAVTALQMMLDMNHVSRPVLHHGTAMGVKAPGGDEGAGTPWRPPICKTIATRGEGIEALVESVEGHRAFLEDSGELERRERQRVAAEFEAILRQELMARLVREVDESQLQALVDRIVGREVDPYTAVETLLAGQGGEVMER